MANVGHIVPSQVSQGLLGCTFVLQSRAFRLLWPFFRALPQRCRIWRLANDKNLPRRCVRSSTESFIQQYLRKVLSATISRTVSKDELVRIIAPTLEGYNGTVVYFWKGSNLAIVHHTAWDCFKTFRSCVGMEGDGCQGRR